MNFTCHLQVIVDCNTLYYVYSFMLILYLQTIDDACTHKILILAIPVPIVNAIFKITEHLDLAPDTRYIAVHLYDKFMCNYFWELYQATEQTENSWFQVCQKISSQSKLYLMSCLQLASKMDSHSKNLRISQVCMPCLFL